MRFLTIAVALTLAAGCGGADGNDDLEVNDVDSTSAALQAPDDSTGDEGDHVGDEGCKDGDHDGHGMALTVGARVRGAPHGRGGSRR